MLEELHVRNLALIEEAWLEFGPGMTALTGETGAGKTALLGALKLLLGERADSGFVRAGASETLVEGRFASAGEEVVVKRRVSADGRSRCAIDGEMATVGALAEQVGPLVDLHGQHDHQALLVVGKHAGYLNRYAGEAAARALSAYRDAREAFRAATEERDALEARLAEARGNADHLRFIIDDIARVDPVPDEDALIEARLPAFTHAEKLAQAVGEAVQLLRADGAATDRMAMAEAALAKVAGIDSALDGLAERVAEVSAMADDIGADLREYRDRIEDDPASLDALQARMGELHGVMRKYGPALADVLRVREEAERALADSDAGEELLGAAQEAVAAARAVLQAAGSALDDARRAAAPRFVAELSDAARDLAMQGADFEIALSELPFESWTADGASRVEFLFSPSTGHPPRSLARIASGGELSRVMLALKGVLGGADTVETLVFDEIDAGVGGATAHAVGRRLATLAATHQVIVVTHLAQVAAYADAQLVVRKSETGGTGATTVERVEAHDRVGEIARMLSGNESATSLAHARELLDEASALGEPVSS